MIIQQVEPLSIQGMYKITSDDNSVFFIREEYLKEILLENIFVGAEFTAEESEELLDAGLICAVEFKAVEFLARSEQCRFKLTQKLLDRGFEKTYINICLDYLEKINHLSDRRFATAWLNTRKINHFEGKTKLLAELQTRGISKEIAKDAVDEFFMVNDEDEICKKAYEKFYKKGKRDEKLIAAMINAGFSYKKAKEIQNSEFGIQE